MPSAGGPPPLLPPQVAPLPIGDQSLALGQWLIRGSVGVSTFYDSNIYQSTTPPILHGPGFEIQPNLLADYNTGIYETSIYGNIDSRIYPTLNSSNDYFQSTGRNFTKILAIAGSSIHRAGQLCLLDGCHRSPKLDHARRSLNPEPHCFAGESALPGAAGVVANAQTIVDPNETYTASANVYKEFNRAYAAFGGSITDTTFETTPSSNFNLAAYHGSGGIWFSPLFYAFANGAQSFYSPAVGVSSTSYFAKGGIGSDRIGFFEGSIYAGGQATTVADNGGQAGGDIYGGAVSYFPIDAWNMTFSVDRLRNVSNIMATSQALGGGISGLPSGAGGGLALSGAAISASTSAQITTLAYRTNYSFSAQTSAFGLISVTPIAYLGTARVDYSLFGTVGIRHQLRDNLSLTFAYNYTRYELEALPSLNFNRDFLSLGAIYTF